eukprot:Platyproteum_vivax@DN7231_c0_g1_i2.p1
MMGSGPKGREVIVTFRNEEVTFGWLDGCPFDEFERQLSNMVKYLTGLPPRRVQMQGVRGSDVTMKDVYDDKTRHLFLDVCIMNQDLDSPRNIPVSKPQRKLLKPETRSKPECTKKGGIQMQFMESSGEETIAPSGLRFTLEEVALHRTEKDCWTILQGKVYDITAYLQFHPGGKEELLLGAGKDCTALFQKHHPWVNGALILDKCCLGSVQTSPLPKISE